MASGLSTITSSVSASFSFTDVTSVFAMPCNIYVAKGEFNTTDIPTTKALNIALYSGSTCSFKPLGMMDQNIGKIGWAQGSYNTDFYTVPTTYTVNAQISSLRMYPDMVNWLDSDDSKGLVSVLFVPAKDYLVGKYFLAMSGTTLMSEGNINLNGDKSVITMKLTKKDDKLTDIIKYSVLTS